LLATPSPPPTAADEDTSPHDFLMSAYEAGVPMLAHFRAALHGPYSYQRHPLSGLARDDRRGYR
jgi:hypothetical protein